jgi:hypothetical protein
MVRITGKMKAVGANIICLSILDNVLLDVGTIMSSTAITVLQVTRHLFHADRAKADFVEVLQLV